MRGFILSMFVLIDKNTRLYVGNVEELALHA
jgi:hypothetical protein